MKKVGNHCSTQ